MPIDYTDISKIAPQAFTHHEYKCSCNYSSKSILMEQELDISKRTIFFGGGKRGGKIYNLTSLILKLLGILSV